MSKSKRHGSNAYMTKEVMESRIIEAIDRKEAEGRYNEENTTPVRIEKDGSRVWQY
jgi:hypothetical protein